MTSSPRHYQYYLVMGPDFYGSVHRITVIITLALGKAHLITVSTPSVLNKVHLLCEHCLST